MLTARLLVGRRETKARNAYYFHAEGYEVLRDIATSAHDRHLGPEPPAGTGWAVALGRSASRQPLFPPDRSDEQLEKNDAERQHGPWFDRPYDSKNACTEGPGASRGGNRAY